MNRYLLKVLLCLSMGLAATGANAYSQFCGSFNAYYPNFYEGAGAFWTPSDEMVFESLAVQTVITGADSHNLFGNGFLANLTSPAGFAYLVTPQAMPKPITISGSSLIYKLNIITQVIDPYLTGQCSKSY